MPNPQNVIPHQFKPGQSGNPGGRPKGSGRDIQALDKLIAQLDAEPGIAKTWLKEALGQSETVVETVHLDGTITRKITRKAIPPNFAFFKMLVEYRNGKVKGDDKDSGSEEDESATDEDGNALEP